MQCEYRATPATTSGPRKLVVGFQTETTADQTQNPAISDDVGLTSICVSINDKRQPDSGTASDFTSYQISRLFRNMKHFKEE